MHRAKVDYSRKEVVFHTSYGKRVCFIGEKKMLPLCMTSALTASRFLRKGCKAFLACVVNSDDSSSKLTDILMVHKFLDVFLEELLGLPPNREIEFSIDLIPDIRPITTAPYRMAPAELKELNV